MHAAADLETTRCLASRLATHLENFAEEVATFGGHPQFTSDPTLNPLTWLASWNHSRLL